jgi:hypothetical protein
MRQTTLFEGGEMIKELLIDNESFTEPYNIAYDEPMFTIYKGVPLAFIKRKENSGYNREAVIKQKRVSIFGFKIAFVYKTSVKVPCYIDRYYPINHEGVAINKNIYPRWACKLPIPVYGGSSVIGGGGGFGGLMSCGNSHQSIVTEKIIWDGK